MEKLSLSRRMLDDILDVAKISAKEFIVEQFKRNRIRIEIQKSPRYFNWRKTQYLFKVVWFNKGNKVPLVYFALDENDKIRKKLVDKAGMALIGNEIESRARAAALAKVGEESKKFGRESLLKLGDLMNDFGLKMKKDKKEIQ